MKKTLIIPIILIALWLSACNAPESISDIQPEMRQQVSYSYSFEDLTFEEALAEYATDVVVAKYVSHKPFGERKTLMEYEFAVLDRVLGNAADKIFIYTSVEDIGDDLGALNLPDGFTDSEYLLALRKINQPIAHTHEDGYTFIRSIVINLDEPSRSMMVGESLSRHSDGLDFSKKSLSRKSIVSYVKELTKDNPQKSEPIRSEKTQDIMNGSPYVLVVEVNELFKSPRTDWMSIDTYYCTAVKVLKGTIKPGQEFLVTFPADTVRPGEQHIVAVKQLEEGSDDWLIFTSKNSLFKMSQSNEITRTINQQSD